MDLTTNKRTRMKMVTARTPSNMAVIKYWGKRDENLILPMNSSVSITLSSEQMSATTTVAINENFEKDRIWLNGKEEDINNPRIQNCLREFRNLLTEVQGQESQLLNCRVHICSKNNFPTAAGLASSAAGYACLVYALAQVYGLDKQELTRIARQGSGSACRSLAGGFVLWNAGERDDGKDSIATQLFPQDHWPELRILILVVNDSKKDTSSSGGMKLSAETSSLLPYRCKTILPERIRQIEDAIKRKDFHNFAEFTIKDSNQFHAVCQDTYPPIRYMNDNSWEIVNIIHQYNTFKRHNAVAYTFDAGPNAALFLLKQDVEEVVGILTAKFCPSNVESFCVGLPVERKELSPGLLSALNLTPIEGVAKYIIHTKVGEGPELLQEHLLNDIGLPK